MYYHEWLNEWLSSFVRPTVKERTYKKYFQEIQRYILPSIGKLKIEELSACVLQRFVTDLSSGGLSSRSVCGIITVLRSSLKRAVAVGVVECEYSSGIIRPKIMEKRIECFNCNEQRKIENYISASSDDKLFGIVFCLYTGLRIGELLALKWQDIDLAHGVVCVSKTCMDSWKDGRYIKVLQAPKTESSNRIIPIPIQLIDKISHLQNRSHCEYFVTGRGEFGSQVRSYQRTFDKLLKKLNIGHRGFHVLRHTFATRAIECGMDVRTLAEILGHKNPTVTLTRYTHSLFDHKVLMMNRLGDTLLQK